MCHLASEIPEIDKIKPIAMSIHCNGYLNSCTDIVNLTPLPL